MIFYATALKSCIVDFYLNFTAILCTKNDFLVAETPVHVIDLSNRPKYGDLGQNRAKRNDIAFYTWNSHYKALSMIEHRIGLVELNYISVNRRVVTVDCSLLLYYEHTFCSVFLYKIWFQIQLVYRTQTNKR